MPTLFPVNAMDNSDENTRVPHEPEPHDDLLSLDAEVRERLEDYYAWVEFLEETSAAIHNHLQQNYYTASNPRDEGEIAPDTGNEVDQDYYDEDLDNGNASDQGFHDNDDFHGGDADAECHEDFQEEFDDEEGGYEDWDGYHD